MNWWKLGCGIAIIVELFTLYCHGKEIEKNKELEKTCTIQRLSLDLAEPLIECQNSVIKDLIEKMPDKKEEPA